MVAVTRCRTFSSFLRYSCECTREFKAPNVIEENLRCLQIFRAEPHLTTGSHCTNLSARFRYREFTTHVYRTFILLVFLFLLFSSFSSLFSFSFGYFVGRELRAHVTRYRAARTLRHTNYRKFIFSTFTVDSSAQQSWQRFSSFYSSWIFRVISTNADLYPF